MLKSKVNATVHRLAIGALSVAALIGIAGLLAGDFGETQTRVALTALAVSLYSVLATPGFAALANPRLRWFASATLVAAGSAFVLALIAVWVEDADDGALQAWGVVSVAAFSCAHATILSSRRRDGDSEAVRAVLLGTLVAIMLVRLLAAALIIGDDVEDGLLRFFGVVAILDALGTALLPIMRRLADPPGRDATGPSGSIAAPTLLQSLGLGPAEAQAGVDVLSLPIERLGPAAQRAEELGSVLLAPTALADGRHILLVGGRQGELLLLIGDPAQRLRDDSPG